MKTQVVWKEGMKFEGHADGNIVIMDAKSPVGTASGMTPKELVACGLGGCMAMDVVGLLKKHRQSFESLTVDLDITTTTGVYPAVFTGVTLNVNATGNVEPQILLEAVQLSQTKYCGVSAMLSQAFPIHYIVILNGDRIGQGQAQF